MTVQRSFKRLVRARMAKTGESYTTARAQLLAGADFKPSFVTSTDVDPIPHLVCSDERIVERTGRGWEEWFDLLDSWGAESMGHTELARRIADLLGIHVLAWNAQAVATSFERSRGKRAVGERVGGDGFVASASKTVAASAEQAFMAFADPSRRAAWLPDVVLTERSMSKPKTARFDVTGGPSRLFVSIEAKGPAKSTVVVEHSRLADSAEREQRKVEWRDALKALKAELERDGAPASGNRP